LERKSGVEFIKCTCEHLQLQRSRNPANNVELKRIRRRKKGNEKRREKGME